MGKATNPRKSKADRRKSAPSAPRQIGANDNARLVANDNDDLVVSGVVLNRSQARRFREAVANQASSDFAARVLGRDEMVKLEAEIARTANQNAREIDAAETMELERGRGSMVDIDMIADKEEPGPAKPRLRVKSRDGLETMFSAGSLDPILYAAGLRYRDDYEMIDPEKALMPPAIDMTSKKVIRGGDHWADKRREIERRIWSVHALIYGLAQSAKALPTLPETHPSRRAVIALNMIAGKGVNLSEMASSGSGRDRVSKSLKRALKEAAIVYGLEAPTTTS